MAVWNSKKLLQNILSKSSVVSPSKKENVKLGAYELELGDAAVSLQNGTTKWLRLKGKETVIIEPGQFGILCTKEQVNIPLNALGLISIKSKFKFDGLVGVTPNLVEPLTVVQGHPVWWKRGTQKS